MYKVKVEIIEISHLEDHESDIRQFESTTEDKECSG